MVMFNTYPLLAAMSFGSASDGLNVDCLLLFTHASFIVTGEVPVLFIVTAIHEVVALGPKARFVMRISSVPMNVNVSAPIHAATAMLTATVTAMSMIEATTGLRAFTFFNIFMFFSIPPFGVVGSVSRGKAFKSYDFIHHITYL